MDNPGFNWDELLPKIYETDEEETAMQVDEKAVDTRNSMRSEAEESNSEARKAEESNAEPRKAEESNAEARKAEESNAGAKEAEESNAEATNNNQINMPTTSSEETALLSLLPPENMDDIELKSVHLHVPNTLSLNGEVACVETRVHTDRGDLMVAVQGDRTKPAILTYHDIGVNYTSFQPFFNFVDMRALLENFCVYHVNAPGQEDGAPTLPEYYVYPTMEELAHQISFVLVHFGIKSFIGIGVGAGGHIFARFAFINPTKVEALMLVNCSPTQAGWVEWVAHKLNSRAMRSRGMVPAVVDYLLSHHLGRAPEDRNPDLTATYRSYFSRNCNPGNLAMFIECYSRRNGLGISRDGVTLRPPVLNLAGGFSPMLNETVDLNARLNPSNSTWMKLSDSALPLDEQPATVSQAFRLFLQGEGYVAPLSPTKIAAFRRLSDAGRRRACRHSPVIRITENPISEACSVAC